MAAPSASATDLLKLTLTQHVNAAPDRVFDALLDPKLVCRWMGPRTMVTACEVVALEPRVGGRYRIRMEKRPDAPHGPGTIYVTGVYQQIDRPRRLVYSWVWEDQQHESRVVYDLRPDAAGGTEVTLTHEGFATAESMQGHHRGWTVCLQQLAKVLEGEA